MEYGPAIENDPRLVTADGVKIIEGLRVWDHDLNKGVIDLEGIDSRYWDGWFHVKTDDGERPLVNSERVFTRNPFTDERA